MFIKYLKNIIFGPNFGYIITCWLKLEFTFHLVSAHNCRLGFKMVSLNFVALCLRIWRYCYVCSCTPFYDMIKLSQPMTGL